jgi:ABC-type multidrug transport system ATPase subunit
VTAILTVSNLTVRLGGRRILDGVGFTAGEGEIVGVIGPNGAGKTTLFESIAGLLPIEGGSIAASVPFFYMPDSIRPWPDQTVRWTLELFARMYDVAPQPAEELALGAVIDQPVRSLSKGEAKRFNIALALLTPHPLLLLDEPFDGLDLRQTRRAMELLRAVAAAGRTLVLSIHQLTDAERICDRFLLLDRGRAIAEGSLTELLPRASTPGAGLEEVFLALT